MAPQLDRFTDESPIIAATGKCRQFAIRVDGELEPHSVVRSVEACQRYPAPFTEFPLEGNGVSSAGQNDRGVSPRSSHQQECRPRMTLDAEKEALRPCPNTSRQYLGLDIRFRPDRATFDVHQIRHHSAYRAITAPETKLQSAPVELHDSTVGEHRNAIERSEERRVGKECRSRWSPY